MLVTVLSSMLLIGILGFVFGVISWYGPGMSLNESAEGKIVSGSGCGCCGGSNCSLPRGEDVPVEERSPGGAGRALSML